VTRRVERWESSFVVGDARSRGRTAYQPSTSHFNEEDEPLEKIRVAFVLSGGSSAGAYIAGALDELLRAFRDSEQHEIDIITGSSAGATTAAVIAHGLCYRNGETDLQRVWVDGVDVLDLLEPEIANDEPISVLSARQLRRIALGTIDWRTSDVGTRAAYCSPNLTVAMTLSNSTPLSYASRVPQPSASGPEVFIQKRNAEIEAFTLDNSVGPRDRIWERIGSVAQASAALPFIFPMVQLARRADNPHHYIHPPMFDGERRFWYYDGGTYNNLPIDLAWHYITVDARRRREPDALKNRRVVVIDPWRSHPEPVTSDPAYPSLLPYAFNMLRDVRTESSMIQFDKEIIGPLTATGGPKGIPGVNRPPVDLLKTFALVIPQEGDPSLRCVYLNHLSAFLDRRFREYDFRRGAADARRVARDLFQITYQQQPESFYTPDADPSDIGDISRYSALDDIQSTRDPRHSVRDVFEDALERRVNALVRHFNLPGPDNPLTDALVTRIVNGIIRDRLPSLWNDETG